MKDACGQDFCEYQGEASYEARGQENRDMKLPVVFCGLFAEQVHPMMHNMDQEKTCRSRADGDSGALILDLVYKESD